MDDIIDRACSAAGGLTRLAESIGQTPQTVWNWRGRGVPIVHCAAVEIACGAAVTRKDMRPNDWQVIWPELAKRGTGSKAAA